ncbi:MAG: Sua5/YciO/YrdC/YwlC family protein [Phycisphaerae bacterium]
MKVMPVRSILPASDETLGRAAEALRGGKLVGLPTETVYGIACSLAQPVGLRALKEALAIQNQPAWVIHVSSAHGIDKIVSHVSPLARRLARRLWPGPLSIQLPLDPADIERLAHLTGRQTAAETMVDGYVTFRCTEVDITRQIIDLTGELVTIVGTAGNPLVESADNLPPAIRRQLSVAVAGPAPRYKNISTLIRVTGHRLDVLREGAIAQRVIRRLEDTVIVFVCSGNTCRSPMAAGLALQILAEKLNIPSAELPSRHIVVRSAGVHAAGGMPAAVEAVKVLGAMGVDIQKHRSAPLTDDLLRRADMIFTMTQAHREEIISRMPTAAEKTFTLDPDGDIDDPIGKGEQAYRKTAQRLEKLIRNRVVEMEL